MTEYPRWRPRRGILLNVRTGRWHVQVWLWGWRAWRPDTPSQWYLFDLLFWTFTPHPRSPS